MSRIIRLALVLFLLPFYSISCNSPTTKTHDYEKEKLFSEGIVDRVRSILPEGWSIGRSLYTPEHARTLFPGYHYFTVGLIAGKGEWAGSYAMWKCDYLLCFLPPEFKDPSIKPLAVTKKYSIYIYNPNCEKDWPTIKEDITKAFADENGVSVKDNTAPVDNMK